MMKINLISFQIFPVFEGINLYIRHLKTKKKKNCDFLTVGIGREFKNIQMTDQKWTNDSNWLLMIFDLLLNN